jgi:hypothetical protein
VIPVQPSPIPRIISPPDTETGPCGPKFVISQPSSVFPSKSIDVSRIALAVSGSFTGNGLRPEQADNIIKHNSVVTATHEIIFRFDRIILIIPQVS